MRLWKAMLSVIATAMPAAVRAADVESGGGAGQSTPPQDKLPHYVEIPISGPRAELQSAIEAQPLKPEDTSQLSSLIRQLADADFRKREQAVDRLKALGQAALPSLKQARESATDPELTNRADSVIRYFERPVQPTPTSDGFRSGVSGRFGRGGFVGRVGGRDGNDTLRVTLDNGTKTVEVRENAGRTIRISDGPNGINMSIETGNGVRELQARTPEQLKKQDAEAFALYQKWMGRGGPGGVIHWRGRGPMVLPPAIPGPVRRARPIDPWMPGNGMPGNGNPANGGQLQLKLRDPAGDDQQQQREMLQLLDELRRLPGAAVPGAVNPPPADAARQAVDFLERLERDQREMRRQAEAIQQRMAEAERRAGEVGAAPADPALPPRTARLGVRVMEGPEADMVTITDVLPGERAETLGLRAFDTIRSINGQKVTDADSLRQTLSAAKGPVVVEILRNGESLKLAEKAQQN